MSKPDSPAAFRPYPFQEARLRLRAHGGHVPYATEFADEQVVKLADFVDLLATEGKGMNYFLNKAERREGDGP